MIHGDIFVSLSVTGLFMVEHDEANRETDFLISAINVTVSNISVTRALLLSILSCYFDSLLSNRLAMLTM